ncbi:hypothetical protein HU200_066205 [Digitaria exilis]|uniref:Methyltransferase n=1 Tax=Digitaria exilis TaxID=1010633 RepID=A0A835DWT9_9POAL|nr:hypothetical protein HU200_066205 [Digitaria exilis]
MKYSKEDKPERAPVAGAGSRAVPVALLVIVLCAFSFYLGGVYSTGRSLLDSIQPAPTLLTLGTTTVTSHRSSSDKQPQSTAVATVAFPECPADFQDYTPCTDPKRWRRYGNYRLSFMERHCPPRRSAKNARPAAQGYKPRSGGPRARTSAGTATSPTTGSTARNPTSTGSQGRRPLPLPGGGTMFPNGVGEYADRMQSLIPGCATARCARRSTRGAASASWGGDLLGRGILTVSLAPRDNHEAQVQFALERGIPAILGIISTQASRSPRHPSTWRTARDASSRGRSAEGRPRPAQEDARAMCFKLYNMKGDIAVWQKSPDAGACYDKLTPITTPAKCDDSVDPDAAWYVPMRSSLASRRPARVQEAGAQRHAEMAAAAHRRAGAHQRRAGKQRGGPSSRRRQVRGQGPSTTRRCCRRSGTDKIRNVMDMNTVYGGFAPSLIKDPVWVMNVSPPTDPTLGVVYAEASSESTTTGVRHFRHTPRTYDLLHLDGLFTAESHRCEMKFVLLEMDRILRPTGYAIIRESTYFLDSVAAIAKGMRWSCEKRSTENKTDKDKILICQKKLWAGKQ